MSNEGTVLIRFVQATRPYNADEEAGFLPRTARRLVLTGIAVYVEPPLGYDEHGKRLAAKKVKASKLPDGLRHTGGGRYELLNFTDDNGKPLRVRGKAAAIAKNEDLIAAAAAAAAAEGGGENPDKDDGGDTKDE
jgi:hypothetical protein